ncbi:hypothetical protein V6N12_041173 [Hibiscus sabdariffa]|uniref:DIRP domain-containing protein n=1 Tax=Hibiscus sabdariffa TaxID=183260 RepID=A0ABR2E5V8_9ROSI
MNNLSNDGGEACSGIEEGITDIVQGKVGMEISSGRKARRLSQKLGGGLLGFLLYIHIGETTLKGHCKKEAPHGFITNLITKLNAENPHLFRTMIIWMAFRLGGKEPVSGTNKRGTCPFVDMESAATGLGARNLSLELIEEDLTEEVNKSLTKGKCSAQSSVQSRQWKPFKENLSSCLSSDLARRLCSFEWFYSFVDYTWFAKMEFVEYLNHVRLGHIPRLTSVEWGVIVSLTDGLLQDIDCMPLNPLENFPGTLRRQNLAVDDFPVTPESQENGHSDFCGPRAHLRKSTKQAVSVTRQTKGKSFFMLII